MQSPKKLGVITVALLTIVSVDSLRNLPAAALFGMQSLFYYVLAAVFFLIPVTFVSARMARLDKDDAGVYAWVKNELGPFSGLLAIWFQWIENVLWYPAILSFVVGNLVYMLHPDSASMHVLIFVLIVVLFTLLTWINIKGIKSSALFSNFCALFGLIIPMCVLIGLGVYWICRGYALAIPIHGVDSFVPHFNLKNSVALVGIMLSYGGMEIAAVHGKDIYRPKTNLPKALWCAMGIILLTLIFSTLALVIVVPKGHLNLLAGLMQAYELFFQRYHIAYYVPIFGVMIIIGGLGSVSNWIIAPTRGLQMALKSHQVLKGLHDQNQHQAPERLLCIQWLLVALVSLLFVFFNTVNQSYWVLTVLAAQLYIGMYALMFISYAVQLRRRRMLESFWHCVSGYLMVALGLMSCIAVFVLGCIPPSEIHYVPWVYAWVIGLGLLIFSMPPFLLYYYIKCR